MIPLNGAMNLNNSISQGTQLSHLISTGMTSDSKNWVICAYLIVICSRISRTSLGPIKRCWQSVLIMWSKLFKSQLVFGLSCLPWLSRQASLTSLASTEPISLSQSICMPVSLANSSLKHSMHCQCSALSTSTVLSHLLMRRWQIMPFWFISRDINNNIHGKDIIYIKSHHQPPRGMGQEQKCRFKATQRGKNPSWHFDMEGLEKQLG